MYTASAKLLVSSGSGDCWGMGIVGRGGGLFTGGGACCCCGGCGGGGDDIVRDSIVWHL